MIDSILDAVDSVVAVEGICAAVVLEDRNVLDCPAVATVVAVEGIGAVKRLGCVVCVNSRHDSQFLTL